LASAFLVVLAKGREHKMNLHDVIHDTWDVIVVGAGPAGSVAARQLSLSGARVLLVDRAPLGRWKVCGCCLNAAAIQSLDAISLGDLPRQFGAIPLNTLKVRAGRTHAEVPLAGGVSLSRETFDAALVGAAISAGVAFLPETHATLGTADVHVREVNLSLRGAQITANARLVLAAGGLSGALLSKGEGIRSEVRPNSRIGAGAVLANAPAFIEPGIIYMACSRSGYVGLVLLEDGRLNVAAAFDFASIRAAGGPGPLAVGILAEAGWPSIAGLVNANWQGTPALTRQANLLADRRVLVLGDAAGYVEPFTGEGMAWALASAIAITPLALQAVNRWTESIGNEWTRMHRETIVSRQRICRHVAWGLRHPAIVRAVIKLLSHHPGLARPVIRRLSRHPANPTR
jgi:flavin-dependent dehydrogenase